MWFGMQERGSVSSCLLLLLFCDCESMVRREEGTLVVCIDLYIFRWGTRLCFISST
jgi:hypothetical protein